MKNGSQRYEEIISLTEPSIFDNKKFVSNNDNWHSMALFVSPEYSPMVQAALIEALRFVPRSHWRASKVK